MCFFIVSERWVMKTDSGSMTVYPLSSAFSLISSVTQRAGRP